MKPRLPPLRPARPEMDLLCACASPAYAAKTADFFRAGAAVDWSRFMTLATNHHVLPLVQRALKSRPESVPAAWLGRLRASQTAIAAYNLRAAATLRCSATRML